MPRIIPHVSFKDWPDDMAAEAMVRAWLNQLPPITAPLTPGGPPLVMLSHMHEPGPKDFDPAEYRRRQFLIAIWLAAHPRGGQVDLVHIDANIWVEGKGGRDLSIYLPGVGLPSVDTYARSWKPYPTVDDLLWAPLRLADATRTPPMLPEFGIARRPDDPTGEQRAELMHEALVVLWAEGCRLVSWWEDLGTAPRQVVRRRTFGWTTSRPGACGRTRWPGGSESAANPVGTGSRSVATPARVSWQRARPHDQDRARCQQIP